MSVRSTLVLASQGKQTPRGITRGKGLILLALAVGATSTAQATTYTWDTAAAGSAVVVGAGTWTTDTSNTSWTTDSGTTKTFWVDTNDASFGTPAAGITIALGTNIVANSMSTNGAIRYCSMAARPWM